MASRAPRARRLVPAEYDEQVALVTWLQLAGIRFFAVPNGAYFQGRGRTWKTLERAGASSGVPDLVLVDLAPDAGRPVAIEMKRTRDSRVSNEQKEWHRAMEERGWIVLVGFGAGDAQRKLESLGYGNRRRRSRKE